MESENFFTGRARYKGMACSGQFKFRIKRQPIKGRPVCIVVGKQGQINHSKEEKNKRQVRGKLREKGNTRRSI